MAWMAWMDDGSCTIDRIIWVDDDAMDDEGMGR